MSASLVGSEMCIRDRAIALAIAHVASTSLFRNSVCDSPGCRSSMSASACLLYTSDAADDM
eukprot:2907012-Alexandrium_andersonii.AAC.1